MMSLVVIGGLTMSIDILYANMFNVPYVHSRKVHNTSAAQEIVPFIIQKLSPQSVVDVGCGLGSWLKVFEEKGVKDLLWVDGDFVDRALLYISENLFMSHNLNFPFDLHKRFDLALNLEVWEHLPPESAHILVNSLCNLSDNIIFSAAIPGQGWQNHINEQWPQYWQKLFSKHWYFFYDIFREKFWTNRNVDFWYSQNMFLVSKNYFGSVDKIENYVYPCHPPHNIHCFCYSFLPCLKLKISKIKYIRAIYRLLRKAIRLILNFQ